MTGYPECKFVSWNEPVKERCPKCNSYMVIKYSKKEGKYIQCSNSECDYKKVLPKEEEEEKDK